MAADLISKRPARFYRQRTTLGIILTKECQYIGWDENTKIVILVEESGSKKYIRIEERS